MAKNTGKGYRKGEVRDRSQVETPVGWVKRDAKTGRFLDVKSDGEPFKGVRREHPDEASTSQSRTSPNSIDAPHLGELPAQEGPLRRRPPLER